MIRQWRAPLIATVVIALVIFGASKATWAAPGAYTVDADGISLIVPLEDMGHINISSNEPFTNIHVEGKCVTRTDAECAGVRHDHAQFLGATFIPWSAFGLTAPFCVSWVQISGEPKHYGDAGEPPVCVTAPTPTATPTGEPSSTPSSTPTQSTVPSPTTTSPTPSEPSATPTGTPPTSTPSPTGTPSSSATPTPSPTAVVCCAPTLTPQPTTEPVELAVTGMEPEGLIVFGLGALAFMSIGVFLILARKLHDRRTP